VAPTAAQTTATRSEAAKAAAIISRAEELCRAFFAESIEEHRPIGPVTKTILDTLMTETASHAGTEELRGSRLDANRFAVKLALATLRERYSMASQDAGSELELRPRPHHQQQSAIRATKPAMALFLLK
jgi:hypothetical protein